ncbi:MAG: TadE/TadG family type IV pilus assembly protein [bacterium]
MKVKKKAQNLIEFVIVTPLLLVILFGIMEMSLFWKATQTVQNIALQAASAAAATYVADNATTNDAATNATNIVKNRIGSLGIKNITLNQQPIQTGYGTAPFALYEYRSAQTRTIDTGTVPLIIFTVDYRDPYQRGVVTQLIYQYRTLLFGIAFSLPGVVQKVTIIPRDIQISSTKIQQYNQY